MSLKEVAELQMQIEKVENKLKELRKQEKIAIEEIVKSGKMSDRWYELTIIRKPGNREIMVEEMAKCYPDQFKQVATFSVLVRDAEKVLTEQEMMQVTKRKPDMVSYEIRKKAVPEVIVL